MKKPLTQKYGQRTLEDLLCLFLGKKIGTGQYRDVYEFGLDTDLVVKIEARGDKFCNVSEWDLWTESKDTPWRKWLAPCVFISSFSVALIQRRTLPCPASRLPKRVPNFLADLKPSNWGLYKGRPVAHDYGNHAAFELAKRAHKIVAGKWHDGIKR